MRCRIRTELFAPRQIAENSHLQKHLRGALPRYGDRAVSGSMVVTRPLGAPSVVLHAIPVEDAAMSYRSPRVAVLLLIIDPESRVRVLPDLVAAAFGLTGAESVVAALLAEGYTIRGIAEKTGRGQTTVRWHVRHIFRKLGVSRQADVVRLVSTIAHSRRALRSGN